MATDHRLFTQRDEKLFQRSISQRVPAAAESTTRSPRRNTQPRVVHQLLEQALIRHDRHVAFRMRFLFNRLSRLDNHLPQQTPSRSKAGVLPNLIRRICSKPASSIHARSSRSTGTCRTTSPARANPPRRKEAADFRLTDADNAPGGGGARRISPRTGPRAWPLHGNVERPAQGRPRSTSLRQTGWQRQVVPRLVLPIDAAGRLDLPARRRRTWFGRRWPERNRLGGRSDDHRVAVRLNRAGGTFIWARASAAAITRWAAARSVRAEVSRPCWSW